MVTVVPGCGDAAMILGSVTYGRDLNAVKALSGVMRNRTDLRQADGWLLVYAGMLRGATIRSVPTSAGGVRPDECREHVMVADYSAGMTKEDLPGQRHDPRIRVPGARRAVPNPVDRSPARISGTFSSNTFHRRSYCPLIASALVEEDVHAWPCIN